MFYAESSLLEQTSVCRFDVLVSIVSQTPFRYRLAHEYGITSEFTELWDRLQNEGRCCGITGSQVSHHECLQI